MRVLVGWLVLSACYRPSAVGECAATCAHDADCPSELACGLDGLCRDRAAVDCRDRIPGDAFPDVVVGNDAMVCFGGDDTSTLRATFCPTALPVGIVVQDFSTDVCSGSGFAVVAQNPGPEVCLVYAEVIAVSGPNVHVTGTRPLVLASAGDITVSGGLDVSSAQAPSLPGAGASFAGCASSPGMNNAIGGGGGGAGGSFRGTAGGGGRSAMSVAASPALPLTSLDFVRGGCAGGHGGVGAGGDFGFAGVSGGAVYMIAKHDIVISGVVNANGAGGGGSAQSQGGHGGGSGGFVGFEAPSTTIETTGLVMAMGGGGGAGGSVGGGGAPGNDANGVNAASGGTGSNAGDGGQGSSNMVPGDAVPGGDTALTSAGGGGGGGGGGFVLAIGTLDLRGTIVPK